MALSRVEPAISHANPAVYHLTKQAQLEEVQIATRTSANAKI